MKIDPFVQIVDYSLFPLFPGEIITIIDRFGDENDDKYIAYPGIYYITNFGRIFSIANGYIKLLSGALTNNGYVVISLMDKNKNNRNILVHRLVAYYFLPYIPNRRLMQVDHIDCNKLNNCVTNLRWVTPALNTFYSNINNMKHASLTYEQVREILETLATTNASYLDLAAKYNVSERTIKRIQNREMYNSVESDYKDQDYNKHILNNNTKLTDYQVKDIIKDLVTTKYSYSQLGEKYGVSAATIKRIKNQESYTEVYSEYRDLLINANNKTILTDDQVKEIIKIFVTQNVSYYYLAKKFNISVASISRILNQEAYYNVESEYRDKLKSKIIPKNNIVQKKSKVPENIALEIYKLEVEQNIPVNQVYNLYKGYYGKYVLNEIKFLRGEYEYLKDKYNLKPAKPSTNAIDRDIAIKAYEMLKSGLSNMAVQKELSLGESTVTDIKLCRKGFKWMLDEGYIPINIRKEEKYLII